MLQQINQSSFEQTIQDNEVVLVEKITNGEPKLPSLFRKTKVQIDHVIALDALVIQEVTVGKKVINNRPIC